MYQLDFTPGAKADLARLDIPIAQRILKKLKELAENFNEVKQQALTGEWQGIFKLRVGDFRILYTFDRTKREIVVHFIRHRSEVYKIK